MVKQGGNRGKLRKANIEKTRKSPVSLSEVWYIKKRYFKNILMALFLGI